MEQDNPWIALLKAWIRALRDDPWIACPIHGSRNEGTKHGSGQTMDRCLLFRDVKSAVTDSAGLRLSV